MTKNIECPSAMSEPSREDDGKAVQMLLAQLIVKDADHPGNFRIIDQPIPASVYDNALSAANRLAAKPERERVEPAELEIFIADKSAERAADALTKEFVITRRRALKGTPS